METPGRLAVLAERRERVRQHLYRKQFILLLVA